MADAVRPLSAPGAPSGLAERSSRRGPAAELPEHLQRKLRQMRAKDQELRLGHLDPALLRYELGPDGQRYAVERVQSTAAAQADAEADPKSTTATSSQKSPSPEDAATPQPTEDPANSRKRTTRGNHPGTDLPRQALHGLTPAKLLLQARVEAAYRAEAASGPRINLTV